MPSMSGSMSVPRGGFAKARPQVAPPPVPAAGQAPPAPQGQGFQPSGPHPLSPKQRALVMALRRRSAQ